MATEPGLFLALWLKKPLQIASVYPSSAYLADAMARCADLSRPGPVLELGAGTGSLTRGLLRYGCPAGRLIVLEREPPLAAVLRREFPAIEVIEDDATRLEECLARRGIETLATVVSSLPIKWLSPEMQWTILRPCLNRLGSSGPFLQMTNAFRSIAIDRLQVAGREVGRIWRNLPPAQIWSYARRDEVRVQEAGVNYLSPACHYRTIWISDVHLGTRGCKADFLLDFLRRTEAGTIYLVGDIVDGWRLRKT